MSGYWEVIAPVGVVALGALVWLAAWLSRTPGAHAADRAHLTEDVHTAVLPVAHVEGRPPWVALYDDQHPPPGPAPATSLADGPEWAWPDADRVTLYGGASGAMGSEFGPGGLGDWFPGEPDLPPDLEATLRHELRRVDDLDIPRDGGPARIPPEFMGQVVDLPDPGPDWLDQQLADLYSWVRSVHVAWEMA